jgi:hypothetical protein
VAEAEKRFLDEKRRRKILCITYFYCDFAFDNHLRMVILVGDRNPSPLEELSKPIL